MSKDITDWFEEEMWPAYLLLVKTPFPNNWGAGVKGKCLQSIEKLRPSKDLRDSITPAIHAQITHRKKLYEDKGSNSEYDRHTSKGKDRTLYSNRMGSTWVNQRGWIDEIPSLSMPEQGAYTSKCQCGDETHGPGFNVCTEHLTRNMDGSIIEKDPGSKPTVLDIMRQYHTKHPDVKRCTTSKYVNQILGKSKEVDK